MELVEVAARVEFIQLLSKVAKMEGMSLREKDIALTLIGDWASEISVEIKKPLVRGLGGGGLQ